MNRVEKSLALKELVHMSICQVVNDLELFFTSPANLTPEENAEKTNRKLKHLKMNYNYPDAKDISNIKVIICII